MTLRLSLPIALFLAVASPCRAAMIYQSASPVVTGTSNVSQVGGTETDNAFYSGVNFVLTGTTSITAIGGHFYGGGLGGDSRIFGVIVATSSLTAAPTLAQIQSGGLASTIITLPSISTTNTVSGAVNLTLGAGTYGIYFGSGLFGTSGNALAVKTVTSPGFTGSVNANGVETLAIRASDGSAIRQAAGARYFVEGSTGAVPEPSSLLLSGLGLAAIAGYARRRARV